MGVVCQSLSLSCGGNAGKKNSLLVERCRRKQGIDSSVIAIATSSGVERQRRRRREASLHRIGCDFAALYWHRKRGVEWRRKSSNREDYGGADQDDDHDKEKSTNTNTNTNTGSSEQRDDHGLDLKDLTGKRVAVVGLGISGIAAAKLACERNVSTLVLVDRKEAPSDAQKKLIEEVSAVVDVVPLFGEDHHADLENRLHNMHVDLVVMSPGVPLQSMEKNGFSIKQDKDSKQDIRKITRPRPRLRPNHLHLISEFAFGAAEFEGEGIRMAAITGTNGKTTVTHFVRQLLTSLGKNCISCGNIGRPISDVALQLKRHKKRRRAGVRSQVLRGNGSSDEEMEPLDAVVVELSSYQLEIPSPFHPRVAAFLNLSSDHMERHGSMDAYAEAKANLCSNMLHKKDDLILLPKDNHLMETHVKAKNATCARATIGKLPGLYVCNNVASVQLPWWFTHRDFCLGDVSKNCLGEHNAWNAAVALFICFGLGFDWPMDQVVQALAHLKTPPHRMERLEEEVEGISFVNDSKATNVDAASVGISALPKPSVVLLGGQAKRLGKTSTSSNNNSNNHKSDDGGGSLGFKELARALSHQKAVISFGQDGEQISEELKGEEIECITVSTLKEAVAKAFEISSSGDTVLLSPACASFDEFRSFEDRGECFRKYVKELGMDT